MTTTRRLLTLGILGLLFGSLCSAQQSQGLDELSWVTTQIDALMAAASPMLVTIGLEIVNGFAFTMFVLLMIRLAFQFFHHHHIMIDPWPIIGFLFLVAGIDVMLAYYAVPIPGLGISFSSLPDKICHYIASTIDVSSYKLVLGKAQEILTNMQQPSGVFPFMQLAVYWMVWFNMALLEALLFLVTIFGFWFYGLTQLVGPIFVALLLFPVFRQYFHALARYADPFRVLPDCSSRLPIRVLQRLVQVPERCRQRRLHPGPHVGDAPSHGASESGVIPRRNPHSSLGRRRF